MLTVVLCRTIGTSQATIAMKSENSEAEEDSPLHFSNYANLEAFANNAVKRGADVNIIPFEEIYLQYGRPEIRKVKSVATYRGSLTLGNLNDNPENTMAIDVERYIYVQAAPIPSSKSYREATSDENKQEEKEKPPPAPLEWDTKYFVTIDSEKTEDDKETTKKETIEVLKGDLQKGYKYGKSIVPFKDDELDSLRYESAQGMEIIGFISMTELKPWTLMSPSSFVIAPKKSPESALALSSLIHAMRGAGLFAIVRLVKKKGDNPRMTILIPYIDVEGNRKFEALVEIDLPFAEDVRNYKFASLDTVKTVKGKILKQHHRLPTDEMVQSMRQFVNAMDISCLADGLPATDDDDGAYVNKHWEVDYEMLTI